MTTTSSSDISRSRCLPGTWGRIIGGLLLAATLAGCSVVRIAYNQAPDLLYWWLDGYFDFGDAQSLRLRNSLSEIHDWHRKTQLPDYADLLREIQGGIAGDVTASQVCDVVARVRERATRISDRLEPTVIALAPTFSPAQLTHLEQQFDKRNREWRREWLEGSNDERLSRRFRTLSDRFEMIYGPLDAGQRDLLRSRLASSPFDARRSYEDRLRRQRDALAVLQNLSGRAPAPESLVRTEMRALFDRSLVSPDPRFRTYLDALTRDGCETVAAVHNRMTATQRERARIRLRDYELDFRSLAATR
ncbi:MAG: DUF6279 family lipoprotein [Thiobacillaceae bacterium]|nr:DUF6279 family lipoprotein [Thiobacillaceae bacterium]